MQTDVTFIIVGIEFYDNDLQFTVSNLFYLFSILITL